MHRIPIEGWRHLPHSYALVNQFQCLEMLRRPELELYHVDVPYYQNSWKAVRTVFDTAREELLGKIPPPPSDQKMDATYRIAFPYNIDRSASPRTVVFGTAEWGIVPATHIRGEKRLAEALPEANVIVVTPSNWSREGFIRSGANPARVMVVPHGVDPDFDPLPAIQKQALRKRLPWGDHFVFLHMGSMAQNKNVPLILRAFAIVAQRHPEANLVLKGIDALYPSRQFLQEAVKSITQAELAIIEPRLAISNAMLSMQEMTELYQSADAYISPYAAEGFNLPVLEAAACGLPVICTAGGPTDDFTTPEFALRIESKIVPGLRGDQSIALEPNFDNLVAHMLRVIEDSTYRESANAAGPKFVAERFSWKNAVDKLLNVLIPRGL